MITNKDIKQYEILVNSLLKDFLSQQRMDGILDIQEYKHIGLIAVYRALCSYDKNKGTLRNYIITAIKNAFIKQKKFDTKNTNNNTDDILFNIKDTHSRDMDYRIDIKILLKILNTIRMDKKNKLLIIDKMKGYSVKELQEKYNLSTNRIYKIIYTFRNKIVEVINDNK